jgi:hypothetical protein
MKMAIKWHLMSAFEQKPRGNARFFRHFAQFCAFLPNFCAEFNHFCAFCRLASACWLPFP